MAITLAQRAGILPDDIDAQVASLSAHLGWDLTCGAKPVDSKSRDRPLGGLSLVRPHLVAAQPR